MNRSWFQDNQVPHYDLRDVRRKQAVALGAVEVSRRDAVLLWRKFFTK
ncbi:DUF4031 domain-containing protein [Xanthomonas campestris]